MSGRQSARGSQTSTYRAGSIGLLGYPIVVSVMTLVIGTLFVPETKDTKIHEEV